jgi:hypothetical protein
MTVGEKGGAIVAGKLPDGESFSAPGLIVGDSGGNQFIVESSLSYPSATPKGAKGFLFGALRFVTVTTASDVSGTLEWVKPEQTEGSYQAEFDTTLDVIGCRYTPPEKGGSVLPGFISGALILTDTGALITPIGQAVTLSPPNVLTMTPPVQDKLRVTITPSTGVFKGSFVYPGEKTPTAFSGVLYQDQTIGAGVFLGPNCGGTVSLTGT